MKKTSYLGKSFYNFKTGLFCFSITRVKNKISFLIILVEYVIFILIKFLDKNNETLLFIYTYRFLFIHTVFVFT